MGSTDTGLRAGVSDEDVLAHYGVPGMKWGVRKNGGASRRPAKEGPSEDAVKKQDTKARVKRSGKQALSNKELQDAITRMNLEQQYTRLAVNEKPAVNRFVSSLLLDIGKQHVTSIANENLAPPRGGKKR